MKNDSKTFFTNDVFEADAYFSTYSQINFHVSSAYIDRNMKIKLLMTRNIFHSLLMSLLIFGADEYCSSSQFSFHVSSVHNILHKHENYFANKSKSTLQSKNDIDKKHLGIVFNICIKKIPALKNT